MVQKSQIWISLVISNFAEYGRQFCTKRSATGHISEKKRKTETGLIALKPCGSVKPRICLLQIGLLSNTISAVVPWREQTLVACLTIALTFLSEEANNSGYLAQYSTLTRYSWPYYVMMFMASFSNMGSVGDYFEFQHKFRKQKQYVQYLLSSLVNRQSAWLWPCILSVSKCDS